MMKIGFVGNLYLPLHINKVRVEETPTNYHNIPTNPHKLFYVT